MKRNLIIRFSLLFAVTLFLSIEFSTRTSVFAQKTLSSAATQGPQSSQSVPASTGQSVSLEGTFSVRVADDFENGKEYYSYYLQGKDQTLYELTDIENLKDLSQGDIIHVEGIIIPLNTEYSHHVISECKIEILKKADTHESTSNPKEPDKEDGIAPSAARVAVILVNFLNDQSRPWTRNEVLDKYLNGPASVRQFYEEASYGKFSYTGDVYDNHGQYYTLNRNRPTRREECYATLSPAIRAVDSEIVFADQNGNRLIDEVVIVFPTSDCSNADGMAGWESIQTNEGRIEVGVNWINGRGDHLHVLAHEQGHSRFYFAHSNSWNCPGRRYHGEGCYSISYGNPYDTMGANWQIGNSQTGHFNAYKKDQLGWFKPQNKLTVTQDGHYSIAPLEIRSYQVQTLIVGPYHVEYRKPIGFDQFIPTSGVLINWDIDNLLNLHNVAQPFILRVGEVFYDPLYGIRITPAVEAQDSIEVNVEFVPAPNLIPYQVGNWPSTINTGEEGEFPFRTVNSSTSNITDGFQDALYVRYVYDQEWHLIDGQTREIARLNAGESIPGTFRWRPLRQCGYYFLVKVFSDHQDVIAESIETDNFAPDYIGSAVNVICPDIDLTVRPVNWPVRIGNERMINFNFITENIGTVGTESFTDAFYVDNQLINSRRLQLQGRENRAGIFSWMPDCGVHKIEVKTDADIEIPEYDEQNNTANNYVWPFLSPYCGPESPLAAYPESQFEPAVSDGKVVWWDARYHFGGDIFMLDMLTGSERQITNDSAPEYHPQISGNHIVWVSTGNFNDLKLYDLTTNTTRQLTFNVYVYNPRISQNYIIWSENGLHLLDLRNNSTRIIGQNIGRADIDGTWIVWEDWRNGNNNSDIYLYDIATGVEQPVVTAPGPQQNPSISGRKIVWVDKRSGQDEIYYKDLIDGIEHQITNNLNSLPKQSPRISGNRIVWEDFHNDGKWWIHLYDSTRQQERALAVGSGPAISGNYIVWNDRRNGNYDIYMYDFDPIKITSPVTGSSGGSSVTITYEMNQGGTLKFYDNNRLVYTTGNGRGIHQYTFTNLAYGKHMLKVKIENNINPGEDVIRYIVKKIQVERKPVNSKRTLNLTPAKTSVSSRKK